MKHSQIIPPIEKSNTLWTIQSGEAHNICPQRIFLALPCHINTVLTASAVKTQSESSIFSGEGLRHTVTTMLKRQAVSTTISFHFPLPFFIKRTQRRMPQTLNRVPLHELIRRKLATKKEAEISCMVKRARLLLH